MKHFQKTSFTTDSHNFDKFHSVPFIIKPNGKINTILDKICSSNNGQKIGFLKQ